MLLNCLLVSALWTKTIQYWPIYFNLIQSCGTKCTWTSWGNCRNPCTFLIGWFARELRWTQHPGYLLAWVVKVLQRGSNIHKVQIYDITIKTESQKTSEMSILLSISDIITIIHMVFSFLGEGGWKFEVQSWIPTGSNRMVHMLLGCSDFFLLAMRE